VPLRFENLDARTRMSMLDEINSDIESGKLYLSPRLTETGVQRYPDLLKKAASTGNDATLASDLRSPGILKITEQRRKRSGGTIEARVPETAAESLEEGEFNPFYIRGLCKFCLEEQILQVEIYRAKQVANPRPESEERIGKRIACQSLLDDLRASVGTDSALGVPAGPNSGLSVRVPR
jgi:hypothetical protein